MPSDGDVTTVVGIIPIAETFGFSSDIRAASQGRANMEYREPRIGTTTTSTI